MGPDLLKLVKDTEIPESIRAELAKQFFSELSTEKLQVLEIKKLEIEKRKTLFNAPFVAVLAGLITLSATFIFDTFTGQHDTTNTITLEQHRQELKDIEVRTTANLNAQAKEREFQYEIVKSELADSSKTNAQRADVLLFLAKAGILNSLNPDALIEMAEKQKVAPDKNIIPSFRNAGFEKANGLSEDVISNKHPSFSSLGAIGKFITASGYACTAFLNTKSTIVIPAYCITETTDNRLELNNTTYRVKPFSPDLVGNINGYVSAELESELSDVNPLKTSTTPPNIGQSVGIIYFDNYHHSNHSKKSVLWNNQECIIVANRDTEFDYNCDLPPGSGGAPIFDKQTLKVIGIHTQEIHTPDGTRVSSGIKIR